MEESKILTKLKDRDNCFNQVDGRLNNLETTQDKILIKLVEHDERFERIERKIDKLPDVGMFDSLFNRADRLLGRAESIKQEDVMRSGGIRRMDDKIDKNARDIAQIKPLVGLTS